MPVGMAIPGALDELLQTQQGCLTRPQARAHGLTDAGVAEYLRSGEWQSVHNGVLTLRTVQDAAPLRAALLTQCPDGRWCPGVAVSHMTAAAIHGFQGLAPDPRVHLVVPRTWVPQHRRTGVRLHRCWTPAEHIAHLDGVPVTTVTWTALSLIRTGSRRHAVVIADSALRTGRCSLADLRAGLSHLARLRGCVQAREVVELARVGVDSPQESRTRMVIVDGGLPHPDVNMRLYDDYGTLLARGELGYRRLMIWLEYDGYDVHTRRRTFDTDRSRQNWLAQRGWYVLRYVDADLRTGERRIQYDVRHALEQAPARIAALPAGLSPEADEARRAHRH